MLIDLFSRKVHLTPLKNKTCKNVAQSIDKYLQNSPHSYTHFFSDEGGEYLGKTAQKIYDKYNIVRYNVHNRRFKNAIAEGYIRD